MAVAAAGSSSDTQMIIPSSTQKSGPENGAFSSRSHPQGRKRRRRDISPEGNEAPPSPDLPVIQPAPKARKTMSRAKVPGRSKQRK